MRAVNFARDVVGAAPPGNRAFVEITRDGGRREWTFGDVAAGSAAEGRRLFDMAKKEGIPTTLNSITQAVTALKRKMGRGDIPLPAQPRSERLVALKILEDAIAGLTTIRDYVANTEDRIGDLEKQFTTIKKAMGLG